MVPHLVQQTGTQIQQREEIRSRQLQTAIHPLQGLCGFLVQLKSGCGPLQQDGALLSSAQGTRVLLRNLSGRVEAQHYQYEQEEEEEEEEEKSSSLPG